MHRLQTSSEDVRDPSSTRIAGSARVYDSPDKYEEGERESDQEMLEDMDSGDEEKLLPPLSNLLESLNSSPRSKTSKGTDLWAYSIEVSHLSQGINGSGLNLPPPTETLEQTTS